MANVPVTELKARLAHYLRMVQRGSEVQPSSTAAWPTPHRERAWLSSAGGE